MLGLKASPYLDRQSQNTKLAQQINIGCNFVIWFFNYSSDSVKMILDARKVIIVIILVKIAFVTRAKTVTIIIGKDTKTLGWPTFPIK